MNKQVLQEIRDDVYRREHFTYLNVSILNPGASPNLLEAKFVSDLTIPVIEDPQSYCAAIVSFNCPASSIPIFKFFDNTYRITLSYLGDDYSEYLTFVSYSTTDTTTKFVFYIQQFLDSINNTFVNLFNLLNAAHPGAVNAAPYVVYQFGKFSLIADGLNYNTNLANPVKIFFNQLLFNFFLPIQAFTFGINLTNFKDVQILVKDNGAGSDTGSLTGTTYTMTTEYDPIALWSFVKSIIVLSSTTGIKNHTMVTNVFVGSQQNVNVYQPIIASIDVSINELNRSSYINFDPKFLTYNDITAKTPMSSISFRIAFLTKDLSVFPLYLFPSQSAGILVQFKHKTILS